MNVAFSSDNNYAPYLAVSILSILKNNSISEICFYILDFGIDNNNKEIIENIDIRYSISKNGYIQINSELYTKDEAFQLSCDLIKVASELLEIVRHEMKQK